MEFIMNNKQTILNWYNKQQQDKPTIPVIPPDMLKCCTSTKGVKEFSLTFYKKHFKDIMYDDIQKIKVQPLLTRNVCHFNCVKMLEILNKKSEKYKHIVGYSITGCPCGRLCNLELHSVLKHIGTGEYIDLTTDWNKETEKFFIPCFEAKNEKPIFSYLINNKMEFFFSLKTIHKCSNKYWSGSDFYNYDINEFCEKLKEAIEANNDDDIMFLF
jgi:hypothetical protein